MENVGRGFNSSSTSQEEEVLDSWESGEVGTELLDKQLKKVKKKQQIVILQRKKDSEEPAKNGRQSENFAVVSDAPPGREAQEQETEADWPPPPEETTSAAFPSRPPVMKIMKRPQSSGSLQGQMAGLAVGKTGASGEAGEEESGLKRQTGSLKTLEERERAYHEARQRIFGPGQGNGEEEAGEGGGEPRKQEQKQPPKVTRVDKEPEIIRIPSGTAQPSPPPPAQHLQQQPPRQNPPMTRPPLFVPPDFSRPPPSMRAGARAQQNPPLYVGGASPGLQQQQHQHPPLPSQASRGVPYGCPPPDYYSRPPPPSQAVFAAMAQQQQQPQQAQALPYSAQKPSAPPPLIRQGAPAGPAGTYQLPVRPQLPPTGGNQQMYGGPPPPPPAPSDSSAPR